MSVPFDPSRGLLVVMARLFGPKGQRAIRLALDTGATMTTVRTGTLVRLGYDPVGSEQRVSMTTASGVEYVPRVAVDRIEVLGQQRRAFPVVAHTSPPSATVDGLLGLDFFRGITVTIDFLEGRITLA